MTLFFHLCTFANAMLLEDPIIPSLSPVSPDISMPLFDSGKSFSQSLGTSLVTQIQRILHFLELPEQGLDH